MKNINGFININKPAGISSSDCVVAVRKILGIKKCGHLGTLDPIASGCLPMAVGRATRLIEYFAHSKNGYICTMEFGRTSVSFDTETEPTILPNPRKVQEQELTDLLATLVGDFNLTVPAYSAKKIDGQRAYKLAREGKIEDAGEAVMHLYDVHLERFSYPEAVINILGGKGVYARSVANHIGKQLGSGAVMSDLVRTRKGKFTLDNAITLDELKVHADSNSTEFLLNPADLLDNPRLTIRDEHIVAISRGISPNLSWFSNPSELQSEAITEIIRRGSIDTEEQPSSVVFLVSESGDLLASATISLTPNSQTPVKIRKVFVPQS